MNEILFFLQEKRIKLFLSVNLIFDDSSEKKSSFFNGDSISFPDYIDIWNLKFFNLFSQSLLKLLNSYFHQVHWLSSWLLATFFGLFEWIFYVLFFFNQEIPSNLFPITARLLQGGLEGESAIMEVGLKVITWGMDWEKRGVMWSGNYSEISNF